MIWLCVFLTGLPWCVYNINTKSEMVTSIDYRSCMNGNTPSLTVCGNVLPGRAAVSMFFSRWLLDVRSLQSWPPSSLSAIKPAAYKSNAPQIFSGSKSAWHTLAHKNHFGLQCKRLIKWRLKSLQWHQRVKGALFVCQWLNESWSKPFK